ncbi:ATP-binding protein [Novosphingobium sp. 9]|uniref:ATP-binding protein n=1 Tax=Novosphingobium sp. 9 TaxID=2025349 RepID=UPI0021B5B50D|nr:ATP-binding protein [Novosphingobium sp. 9]
MSGLIASHDWAGTPLGPISDWSASLRAVVDLVLASRVPMALMMGARGTMIYNDPYIPIAGGRHPQSLGSSVLDSWPEVAAFNQDIIARVTAGEAISYDDQMFRFERNGQPEAVYLDLDYSAVRDEHGEAIGVLAVLYETTATHEARDALDRTSDKLAFLDALGQKVADSRDADSILSITTRMTGEHLALSNCAYADMDADEDGFTIRGNWFADGSPSILGHYSLSDFGALAVRELHAGRPLIVNDNLRELAPHEAATFQAIGIGATICMPLVKGGRLTALMAIHTRGPRQWNDYDLDVIREVTQRSWAHVERVGVEADLRKAAMALGELNETLERRVEERSRQLSEAEDALRQAQKMEAVGQLTGGLAHDFNNLLMGLGGSLEMIRNRVGQGRTEDLDRYFAAAEGAVDKAAALTHRLLAFARRQTLDPLPTDVGRLMADLEDLVSRTMGPAINVGFEGGELGWSALIDRNQLENAVLNLCINARDAMPDGGALTVVTENRTLDEPTAGSMGLVAGDYISVSVSDTGSGMSPDIAAKAFDPFFTTKPLGQGTGLGLSMIYGFVRQSGGQVEIVSEPGQGARITMYLPRSDAGVPVGLDELDKRSPSDTGGHGQVVLVVDDEPMIRMLIVEVLEDEGFTVIEAADGPSAAQQLERAGRLDLLVTDVGLPNGMNGRQVADLARQTRPSLKVLFITGYAENVVAANGQLEANSAILTKPFMIEALVSRVHELVA